MVFQIQPRLSTNTTIRVYTIQFKETILFRDEITVSICHTKNLSRVVKKSIEKNIVFNKFWGKNRASLLDLDLSVGKLKEERENEKKKKNKCIRYSKLNELSFNRHNARFEILR